MNNIAKLQEQLARKTQECEELKIQLMQKSEVDMFFNTPIEGWSSDPCNICESKNNYEQLKQECEQKEKEINELHLIIDRLLEASGYDKNISTAEDFEDIYADIDYKSGLLDELKQECEELKKELNGSEKWRIKAESLNEKLELNNDRYRKALEEIEKVLKKYKVKF